MAQGTILITGAAGGVGRVSCAGLRARGWRVVGYDLVADPGCCDAYHQGDLAHDPAGLRTALAGCDAVLHLAAVPRTNADFLTELVDANIVATWRVLEAAHELGLDRVLLASSINAANGRSSDPLERVPATRIDPGNPYGLSKVFGEDAAAWWHRHHGLRSLCIRIGSFPRSRLSVQRMLEQPDPVADHYLSHDDWLRFLERALAADYGHGVVYALSRPRGDHWHFDPDAARELIGYQAQDRWPEGLPAWLFEPDDDAGPRRRGWTYDRFMPPPGQWRGDRRRVLVTGAAGAIGRHLGPALAARGWTPVGFDRAADPGGYVAFHQGDITDRTALDAALADCGAVVHLAADPRSFAPFDDLVAPNIRGLWTVLEAAHAAGIPRLVLASSINACNGPLARERSPVGVGLADPGNVYGLTKVLAERAGRLFHRHFGTDVVALRLGWFPRDEGEIAKLQRPGGSSAYLSWDDCAGWIDTALSVADPGYVLAYALSARPERPRWDLTSSIADLGYQPCDRWPEGMPAHLRELALRATSPA